MKTLLTCIGCKTEFEVTLSDVKKSVGCPVCGMMFRIGLPPKDEEEASAPSPDEGGGDNTQ